MHSVFEFFTLFKSHTFALLFAHIPKKMHTPLKEFYLKFQQIYCIIFQEGSNEFEGNKAFGLFVISSFCFRQKSRDSLNIVD